MDGYTIMFEPSLAVIEKIGDGTITERATDLLIQDEERPQTCTIKI